MHSRYYATTRIYEDGASCGFVVTLRYRLAAACPSMVLLLQLPPLHTQREGKLMKVLTRIMPSNVGSEAGSFCNSLQLRSTLFLKC